MRDVVEQTGVAEATLRAWETRYGFPEPRRLESGHRRYADSDVELVKHVARLRDAGLPMPAAIEQARHGQAVSPRSVFAALRRRRPDLQVAVLPKRSLVALSHAIEDESAAGARDLLLFGAFQRVRHYRPSAGRWRELARAAEQAFVFADFSAVRRSRPLEIPIRERDPLEREWVVVCDSSERGACLVGWEPPGQDPAEDINRLFETVWTTDRESARYAARICCELARDDARDEVEAIAERLAQPIARSADDLRDAESLTQRMIAYLGTR
jgi:DICT domain-containing protein